MVEQVMEWSWGCPFCWDSQRVNSLLASEKMLAMEKELDMEKALDMNKNNEDVENHFQNQ